MSIDIRVLEAEMLVRPKSMEIRLLLANFTLILPRPANFLSLTVNLGDFMRSGAGKSTTLVLDLLELRSPS